MDMAPLRAFTAADITKCFVGEKVAFCWLLVTRRIRRKITTFLHKFHTPYDILVNNTVLSQGCTLKLTKAFVK
jgi:hypothetical protein